MKTIEKALQGARIIPVIAIEKAEKAAALAGALRDGGIFLAEITFRTEAAVEAIAGIKEAYPDMTVGAGTVLSAEQAARAVAAGAEFIVSPGYGKDVVAFCREQEIPVLPGCSNASELMAAVNAGLNAVKFFPAEALGGLSMLKALAPAFPSLRFVPTGGINEKNLTEYLQYPKVIACGGTWMVEKELISQENWREISNRCRKAVAAAESVSLCIKS